MNLAFALTVTKYLLTTYGTSNVISLKQLNGHIVFGIQLIQISRTQEEEDEYDESNNFIPQNRSIFTTLV